MKVCRFLALALFAITMSFTACGDDESSSGVAPESAGEISTNSSASSSDDDSSSSKGGKSSGSQVERQCLVFVEEQFFLCKIQPVHRLQEQLFCKVE